MEAKVALELDPKDSLSSLEIQDCLLAPLKGKGRTAELHRQHMKTRLMQETALHLKEEYEDQGRPKPSNISEIEKKSIKHN